MKSFTIPTAIPLEKSVPEPVSPDLIQAGSLRLMEDQARILEQYQGGRGAVLAAPGAGKTTLISHLVARWVLEQRIPARRILVLTFTESAAAEFAARTQALLAGQVTQPTFSTIHAFCHRILRQLHSDFYQREVLTEERKYALLEEMLAQHGLCHSQLDYVRLLGDLLLPRFRQKGFQHLPDSPEAVASLTGVTSEHATLLWALPELVRSYEARLAEARFIDYDMMISETHRLLKNHPQVLRHLQQRYSWIVEDEAQDSNPLQSEILELLAGEQGNLLRVGDPNQSIYGFSGADYRRLTHFAGRAQAWPMGQSNRSAQPVMDLANAFLRQYAAAFPSHVEIRPGGHNPEPGWIWIKEYATLDAEVAALLQASQTLLAQNQTVGLLCRTNLGCSWLAQKFEQAGVPLKLHHESSAHFFRSPLVFLLRDLIAYLLAPRDFQRLQQLLSGLGYERNLIKALFPEALTRAELEALAQQQIYVPGLEAGTYARLSRLAGQLLTLIDHLHYPASWLLEWIAVHLLSESREQFQIRLLHQLWLKTRWNSSVQSLEQFLHWLEKAGMRKVRQLLAPEEPVEDLTCPGLIHCMTVHKAKGLEWDAVLLPLFQYGQPFSSRDQEVRTLLAALQEGLPYQAVLDQIAEEEKTESIRLVYVALTRARRSLMISCSPERRPEAGLWQAPASPLFQSLRSWYTMQKAEKRF